MFTSVCEGFPYCICHLVWGSVRLGEQHQVWLASSRGMQQGINQNHFSCLSPLINVGETVVVTSMVLPSAANSLAICKGENKT